MLMLLFMACTNFAMAQRTISGTLIDGETNEPLIGASIIAVGTSSGTITDFDGKYSITVPEGVTALEFSYTGFGTKIMNLTDSNVMDLTMTSGAILDEVVVIGYGSVRKRDVTGAVASLKEDDFNKGVITSADQLLQGRVPGVNMVNNSGQPGGAATVKVRGNNSIRAGADPLYVVDGIPLDGRTPKAALISDPNIGAIENSNPLNFINPSDIASIEVLKDASSAAIYGARGANGVILITTKKARDGDPQVNFNLSLGTSSVAQKYDVLDANGYRAALTQYGLGGDGGGSVDAFDEITRSGSVQNYNFSIGNGNENGNVRFSAGYQNVQGILKESGIKRYNATLNSQYNILDGRAGVDAFIVSSFTDEDLVPVGTNAGFTGNLIGQALQWNPTIPLMTDGDFTTGNNNTSGATVGATTINPIHLLDAHSENANTVFLLGSLSPYFNITDKLQYRYRYGLTYGTGTSRGTLRQDINIEGVEGLGFAAVSTNELSTQLHSHTLNYSDAISENLDLGLLAGFEYQKFNFKGYGVGGRGFDSTPDDFDMTNILQNSNNDNRILFSFADPLNELQSFFGRANLGIRGKYLLTATVRADGSTKFGENNKYGIFPSFAAAWNISDEDFIDNTGAISNLKLRAGWGITGNQEFPGGSSINRFGFNPNAGVSQENVGNPDLQWEESSTFNVGLDFGLFDYRLTGTIDYYNRVTSNLLLDPFVQEPGPPIRAWKNIDGEVANSGVELGITGFVLDKENLTLSIGANVAFLNNEFRNYTGADILTGNLFGQGSSGAFVQKNVNGLPLNTFFVRDFTGLNDDGTSEYANDGALIEAGDPNAKTVLGLTLNLGAGDLNFGMNWNGAFGHMLFNNTAMSVIPIGNLGNRNIDAALIGGSVQESTANPIASSSRYLEKGDFFKLANATVSYDLGNVINGINGMVVSLTGQNLITLTNYSGFDPEINTVNLRNGVPSAGIEYIPYPTARVILLGLNASF